MDDAPATHRAQPWTTRCVAHRRTLRPHAHSHRRWDRKLKTEDNITPVTFLREATRPAKVIVVNQTTRPTAGDNLRATTTTILRSQRHDPLADDIHPRPTGHHGCRYRPRCLTLSRRRSNDCPALLARRRRPPQADVRRHRDRRATKDDARHRMARRSSRTERVDDFSGTASGRFKAYLVGLPAASSHHR